MLSGYRAVKSIEDFLLMIVKLPNDKNLNKLRKQVPYKLLMSILEWM